MSQLDDIVARIESTDIDESDDQVERLLVDLESAASLDGGLELLVKRFTRSPEVLVVRSLSFILARVAADGRTSSLPVLLDFADTVDTDDVSTLINSISALKRHRFDSASDDIVQARKDSVSRLVHMCLSHTSTVVRFSVLEYLEQLLYDGQLDRALTRTSLSLVTHTLADWRDSGDNDIAQDARALLDSIKRSGVSD